MIPSKSTAGRFFEDFQVGEVIRHAGPRTITSGDVALYQALYGSRFAVQSSSAFAREAGYADSPVDDLLVYNVIFGKTVSDISMNSIAALGVNDCRFMRAVLPGDTLTATSEVIGLEPTRSRRAGVIHIRTVGRNQRGEVVLEMSRSTLLKVRDPDRVPEPTAFLAIPRVIPVSILGSAVPPLNPYTYDRMSAGSAYVWGDYEPGERIDHIDGMTLEESEQQLAVRLYQNVARIHINAHSEQQGPLGRRIAYGGAVLSIARSLTYNGLGNAFHVAGINSGRHVASAVAGDTIYAWSEILERIELPGRRDIGVLRVRTIAAKNMLCSDFPLPQTPDVGKGNVVLDLDYLVALPR